MIKRRTKAWKRMKEYELKNLKNKRELWDEYEEEYEYIDDLIYELQYELKNGKIEEEKYKYDKSKVLALAGAISLGLADIIKDISVKNYELTYEASEAYNTINEFKKQTDYIYKEIWKKKAKEEIKINQIIRDSKYTLREKEAREIIDKIEKMGFYYKEEELINSIFNQEFHNQTLVERLNRIRKDIVYNVEIATENFIDGSISIEEYFGILEAAENQQYFNYKRLGNTEMARFIAETDNQVLKDIEEDLEYLLELKEEYELNIETPEYIYVAKYNAILDEKTCDDCESLNGMFFDIHNKPLLPQHPNCRCYYDYIYIRKDEI